MNNVAAAQLKLCPCVYEKTLMWPYPHSIFEEAENLQLSSAANCRWRFKG